VSLLVGCGGSKDNVAKPETAPKSNTAAPESKEPIDVAIRGLTEWKTKMCACTDAACADKTHEEYKAWENDTLEPMFKDTKLEELPKDKVEVAERLEDERKTCRRKFREASAAERTAAAMAKFSEFKDMMCACKTADCAKKVSDEMTTWSQEEASKGGAPAKMSEDDIKKATELGTMMGECMQKAMGSP